MGGDAGWCVSETEEGADNLTVDLEQGNLVCGYFRDDRTGRRAGSVSVLKADTAEPIKLNEGKNTCEADDDGVVLACYPPETSEVVVEAVCSMGHYEFPMTIEEEEQAMCLISSPAPESPATPPPKEENPVSESAPDATVLIIQADADADEGGNTTFATTAENLGKFIVKQRTNIPGALQDMASVAAQLREFGFATFRVIKANTKEFPKGRKYLVFKGNPRAPGNWIARRELIRSFGRHTFQNPNIVQLGFGMKNALRAGAKATVISFILVASLDVMLELLEEDPSLAALGVTIAVDAGKLAAAGLAGALAAGAIAGGPVFLVAGAGLLVGLAIGMTLDAIDETFGITDHLRKRAKEFEAEVDRAYSNFLYQLEWCIMHPYVCFGGSGGYVR